MTSAALVSAVVTSFGDAALVHRCLAALVDQSPLEIIVADGSAHDPSAWIARAFPGVTVLHLPGRTVPELRWAGARKARGSIIAATESWMQPAPGWCAALADGHALWPQAPVIGGDVALEAGATSLGAGFYLCEYAAFAPPAASGTVRALSSANLSYKREALLAEKDVLDAGLWEIVLHERWQQEGRPLRMLPATVIFRNGLSAGGALSMRFRHARAYAAGRFSPPSRIRRALYAAGCPLLPVVLTWRVVRDAAAHGRVAALGQSFGWVLLLNASWALGECAGYICGPPAPPLHRSRVSPVAR